VTRYQSEFLSYKIRRRFLSQSLGIRFQGVTIEHTNCEECVVGRAERWFFFRSFSVRGTSGTILIFLNKLLLRIARRDGGKQLPQLEKSSVSPPRESPRELTFRTFAPHAVSSRLTQCLHASRSIFVCLTRCLHASRSVFVHGFEVAVRHHGVEGITRA
jgi:hypothetical protein